MVYKVCRDCEHRCTCCSGRYTLTRCSGCENHYDEFAPAEHINFCPVNGRKLNNEVKNCLTCKHSFSEEKLDGDVLHCMLYDGKVVDETNYCADWNG